MTTNNRRPRPRPGGSDGNHTKTETIKAVTDGDVPALSMLPQSSSAITLKPATALDLLDPKSEIVTEFTTSTLTVEMIYNAIGALLNEQFIRTEAGFVTLYAAITDEGEPMLAIKHWKSFNFPEEDEVRQGILRLGALVDIDA